MEGTRFIFSRSCFVSISHIEFCDLISFSISINDRICRLFGSATLMDEQETVVQARIWIELSPKGTYGGVGGEK